jgi:hypothetical protein
MLEDDLDRIGRFTSVVVAHRPSISLVISRTAPSFISRHTELNVIPELICLDHDLMPDSTDDPDPGDGRDVASYLWTHFPTSPVLIHSTNSVAADSMKFSLIDHGWFAERILPIGDDWIEAFWFPTALEMAAKLHEPRQ